MNTSRILTGLILLSISSYAQKPAIDTSMFDRWPSIDLLSLSNNGKYAIFNLKHVPQNNNTLIFQSLDLSWKYQLKNALYAEITADSKNAIIQEPGDSIGILALGQNNIEQLKNIASFKIPKQHGQWIAYQSNAKDQLLIVKNLQSGKILTYKQVTDFWFTNDGLGVILQIHSVASEKPVQLYYVNLVSNKTERFWEGIKLGKIIFDAQKSQLAFTSPTNGALSNTLWHYQYHETNAKALLIDDTVHLAENLQLSNEFRFNNDGTGLFIILKHPTIVKPETKNDILVNIWSYADSKLRSHVLAGESKLRSTNAILNIKRRQLVELDNQGGWINPNASGTNNDFVIIMHTGSGDLPNEWNWNKKALNRITLASIKTGQQILIADSIPESIASSYLLSPSGKYIIYFDPDSSNYFSFEISSGNRINVTKSIPAKWLRFNEIDYPDAKMRPIGVAGFGQNDDLFLYDQHDIFRVYLSGQKPVKNITNRFGQKNNITFRILTSSKIITTKELLDGIILNAFNRNNKENGFYRLSTKPDSDPIYLTMEACLYTGPSETPIISYSPPIRARDTPVYILRKETASSSRNYYLTSNFFQFTPLTNVHPETDYNLVTAELIKYEIETGKTVNAILYKPANFDSTKKYPVIFHYYERFSDGLNQFIEPGPCQGPLNIPYFVSHGYIVCVPDIHYTLGHPGQSAMNHVIAAARHLGEKSYIDTSKMGLQGFSFGGFETNFIITRTNIFKAAMSASGMSNFLSAYGSIVGDGSSRQRQYELYRDRIGATPWQRLDQYLENSPVLKADRIETPLLMMNNKDDGDVPFSQGIELFTSLRRLNKKVWMLEYKHEGHALFGDAAKDFSLRIMAFFDHFLKGTSMPLWMSPSE